MSSPEIRNARAKPANTEQLATGLIAFASFDYGSIRLSVTLRRTASGSRLYLSYPSRIVNGRRLPHIEPLSDDERNRIEAEVLGQLGFAARKRA